MVKTEEQVEGALMTENAAAVTDAAKNGLVTVMVARAAAAGAAAARATEVESVAVIVVPAA